MFVRAALRYAFCGITVALLVQTPCFADWADSFATSVLQQVVRQEASNWIRRKLYASPQRSSSVHHSRRHYQSSENTNDYGGETAPSRNYLPPAADPSQQWQPSGGNYRNENSSDTDSNETADWTQSHKSVSGKVRKHQYDNVDIPPPPKNGYGLEVPAPPSGLPAAGAVNGLSAETIDDPAALEGEPAPRRPSGSAASLAFDKGTAGYLSFSSLIHAGVLVSCPMSGGVHNRHDEVKYIILHSTETASPANAQRVIRSWSNRGTNHPGAQFVVDRDGTIYATTNPDNVTTHINVHKALAGYTNENSIGIEIVRAGSQHYTHSQLSSVLHLVTYLQQHYGIPDSNVTTHAHVQPSDRCDPVDFNMIAFEHERSKFRTGTAVATKPRAVSPATRQEHSASSTRMPSPAPTFHRAI